MAHLLYRLFAQSPKAPPLIPLAHLFPVKIKPGAAGRFSSPPSVHASDLLSFTAPSAVTSRPGRPLPTLFRSPAFPDGRGPPRPWRRRTPRARRLRQQTLAIQPLALEPLQQLPLLLLVLAHHQQHVLRRCVLCDWRPRLLHRLQVFLRRLLPTSASSSGCFVTVFSRRRS